MNTVQSQTNALQNQQKQIDQLINQLKDVQDKSTAGAAASSAAVTVPNPTPPAGVPSFYSDAGSFLIPGTKTTMKVGGFAKLDVSYDLNAGIGEPGSQSLGINSAAIATGKNGFSLPGTQAAHQIDRYQMSARTSRIALQTNTPTELGNVKFFLEGDFQGGGTGNQSSSNSAPFRFRQAYGTLGNWTLGETFTLWQDRATLPGSWDISSGAGMEGGKRTPVIQYRLDLDPEQKNQISFGLENPVNDFQGADTETFSTATYTMPTNNVTKAPDYLMRFAHNWSGGRVYATTLLRYLEVNDAGSIDPAYALTGKNMTVHGSALGWGLNLGGKLYTGVGHKNNNVVYRLIGGQGISSYINAGNAFSAVINRTGSLNTVPVAGYTVAYQHWFSDQWQANAIFGQQHVWNPNTLLGPTLTQGLQKNLSELDINAVWFPYPWVQMGPSYYYAATDVVKGYNLTGVPGTTRLTSGTAAHDHRFMYSTIIGF
ncbi:DcaP family trimeric outer membrane transporter [Telmatospirillum sp.]|uniref:DcaP family trimeric outer membrane transporter n=1 Tax=Telmatospirillum sp. TaxID=2079197 RepID=UPI00283DAEFA|nr:DcaP family trimeric outer membrane transporter [Telmatospirillum sp.]MDR3438760.1 DcaP family trimeric outer membrane transporter [Telmatospirillum sp.]